MHEDFHHQNLMVRVGSNAAQNEKPQSGREQIPRNVIYVCDALRDIVGDRRNRDLKVPLALLVSCPCVTSPFSDPALVD
jgi:hypothetical protein